MRVFLAINDPNTGMLYGRFKEISKNARSATDLLMGERDAMQVYIAYNPTLGGAYLDNLRATSDLVRRERT